MSSITVGLVSRLFAAAPCNALGFGKLNADGRLVRFNCFMRPVAVRLVFRLSARAPPFLSRLLVYYKGMILRHVFLLSDFLNS